jgi:aspartate/glutamate/glutamine transport system substrate-binding protein
MRALAAALLVASVAHAATPAEIRARGKIIVSVKNQGSATVSAHKDPAHFEKRNFEIELARAIAKKIVGDPDKLELKLMPRAVRLFAVAEDRVDLVISMVAITEERRKQVDFSQPYYEGGLALLVSAKSKVVKLEDLQGKKILALRQTANDPSAELKHQAQGITFSIERVSNFAEAAKLIEGGKADGLVSHAVNIDTWLATRKGLVRSPMLTDESFAVAVKKGNAELLAAVNQVIVELRKSGELAAMQKRFGLAGQD